MMGRVETPTSEASKPDRWWLVSATVALLSMATAAAALYLPWWWSIILLLGLSVFLFVFFRHPAYFCRNLASAAIGCAITTSVFPALNAFIQLKPGTFGKIMIDAGWPAIFCPWVAAGFFAWLDCCSRTEPSQSHPKAADTRTAIKHKQTGVEGPVTGGSVSIINNFFSASNESLSSK